MRLLLLIEVTRIPEVVEHLMVGLWVLMRNPHLAQEMRSFNQDQATKAKNDVFLDDLQDVRGTASLGVFGAHIFLGQN